MRRWARRVGVVVALAAYLVAAVGFPVPAAVARGEAPYPCMNLPCGCCSAEQCWRGCCCLTVEQRWAWAREHNVEPPPYAERPGEKPSRPSCTRPCCAKTEPAEPAPAAALRLVGGWATLGCRGHATVWIASGAVTVPPAAVFWRPLAPPGEWLSSSPDNPLGPSLVPPDPPPRLTRS